MTTADAAPVVSPAVSSDRVRTIDIVRGLAVLGILVMNVVEFAWPDDAYTNPGYAGGSTGADVWTWYLQTALFDGKMRALFSMLFGAGIVLFAERLVAGGQGARVADLLLRRCLWLVPFGIVHRFFLQWTGDILYQYGLLGALAVAFRGLRPRTLIALGAVWLLAFVPIGLRRYAQVADTRTQAVEASRLQAAGETVPEALAQAQRRWQAREKAIPPTPEALQKEIAEVRVGYWQLFRNRWDYHHQFQSSFLYYHWVFDVLGMMWLGMGLLKVGFFHGQCRTAIYVVLLVAGGLVAAAQLAWALAWHATGFRTTELGLKLVYDLTHSHARAVTAIGWASAVILVVRGGILRPWLHALEQVGRMAFSCYILQTVVCSLLFFGYGFGLFGAVPRAWLMAVVVGVSLLQVVFCRLWLARFRQGPLEWAWRSLTWWRVEPVRIGPA